MTSLMVASCISWLPGCGGGSGSGQNDSPIVLHAGNGTVILRSPLASGVQCKNGGATIDYGIDENANGALEPGEIDGSNVVCNGESGVAAMVRTSALELGEENCAAGGIRISIGLDSNSNRLLDDSEVTNNKSVICHGVSAALPRISEPDLERLMTETTVRIEAIGTEVSKPGERSTFLGGGSGFFVSEDGLIVTNNHVVAGASQLSVFNNKGELIDAASVVGVAECADLAVIKLQNKSIKRKPMSWSTTPVARGLDVVAVGYPADVTDKYSNPQFTYTKGGITSLSLSQGMPWGYVDAFTHDAQIYSGSSGGPLVDASTGNVVGVNYMATRALSAIAQPRFYSISANTAKGYSERLSKGENIDSIGINGEVFFDEIGLPKGVFAKAIRPGSQADQIGLKPGDLITEINSANLFVRADKQIDSELSRPNFSMERYCGVLASNPPNNAGSLLDKGKELPIRVLRSDGYGHVCTGSVNGAPLVCSSGDDEPNGTYATAQKIAAGTTVNGVIKKASGRDPESDVFQFTVTKETSYRARLSTNLLADLDLHVAQFSDVPKYLKSGSFDDYGSEDLSVRLLPGTYYLVVDSQYASSLATEYRLSLSEL